MRRIWFAAAVCVVCVLPVGASEPARVAHRQQAAADGFPAPGAAPLIKLLSAGAEPRAALRYAVPAGHKGRLEIAMDMGITMDMEGMMMPEMKMPTMKTVVEMSVSDVAANGDMTFQSRIASMHMDTAGLDANMSAVANSFNNTELTGLQASGTMTNRGLTGQKLKFSGVSNAQAKQMIDSAASTFDSLSMPFPEEAVGKGAKWETRQRTSAGGVSAMLKTTIEVVSVQGSRVTLKISTETTAPSQPIKNPALPADADATLTKLKGTGKGTMVVDLNSMSSEGESSANSSMVMNVRMQGMEQDVATTTSMKIKVTTVK